MARLMLMDADVKIATIQKDFDELRKQFTRTKILLSWYFIVIPNQYLTKEGSRKEASESESITGV